MRKQLKVMSINFPFQDRNVVQERELATERAFFDFDLVVIRPSQFEGFQPGNLDLERSIEAVMGSKRAELSRLWEQGGVLVVIIDVPDTYEVRAGGYRRYRLDDLGFHPLTYGHMIEEYVRHPEAKSLGPDDTPCTAETRGLLQRAHITAGRIRYIDKETSSMWPQGDDLSVVTDNDEAGFRVIEYGKSRKVVLPDSLKREIQGTKLQRELRRRGIGQHTIEKALHAHVRVNTYRKIVEELADFKQEKCRSDT